MENEDSLAHERWADEGGAHPPQEMPELEKSDKSEEDSSPKLIWILVPHALIQLLRQNLRRRQYNK
ncbi:MAG: hypothetical protein Q7S31_03250 [bacterium]|nr:hypothetical protein [bacterium]